MVEAAMKVTYRIPDAGLWTRWDEIKQRIGNCRRLLVFAWLGLTTDSTVFAVVLVNAFRTMGDGLISVVTKEGEVIDPDGIER